MRRQSSVIKVGCVVRGCVVGMRRQSPRVDRECVVGMRRQLPRVDRECVVGMRRQSPCVVTMCLRNTASASGEM
jgi:hypothetical protein